MRSSQDLYLPFELTHRYDGASDTRHTGLTSSSLNDDDPAATVASVSAAVTATFSLGGLWSSFVMPVLPVAPGTLMIGKCTSSAPSRTGDRSRAARSLPEPGVNGTIMLTGRLKLDSPPPPPPPSPPVSPHAATPSAPAASSATTAVRPVLRLPCLKNMLSPFTTPSPMPR